MKSRFLIPSKQTEFRSFFVCYCFANIIRTFVLLSVLREMSNSSLSCAVAMVCQFISCFHITCSSIPNIIATNSIHIYGYKSSDQIQLNWNIKRISHTHALALHPLCVYWKLLSSFDFSLCLHIITHTHTRARIQQENTNKYNSTKLPSNNCKHSVVFCLSSAVKQLLPLISLVVRPSIWFGAEFRGNSFNIQHCHTYLQ